MTDCKQCRDCGEVKPIKGNFHLRKRGKSLRPESYCRECRGLRWKRWAVEGRAPKPREPVRSVWVRPDHERACDIAFTQWQGGTPRQDWRVAI